MPPAPPRESPGPLPSADVMEERRVLIVDDDPSILELVEDLLQAEGYETATARHGAEALELVQRDPPQIVLLDMRMPIMSGWDFAEALRARRIKVRLLVMTAATDAHAWARQIDADGVLPKPFELEQLLGEVRRLMSHPGQKS